MKINGWIILGLLISTVTSSRGLADTTKEAVRDPSKDLVTENFDKLERGLRTLQHESMEGSPSMTQLEKFQFQLWRAMALDPALTALVPVSQVPKNLFSDELTAELIRELEDLKGSSIAARYHAQVEFNTYIQVAEHIIAMRRARKFPESRAIGKRGTLENAYYSLSKKIVPNSTEKNNDVPALLTLVQNLRETAPRTVKETKKEIFANGNQFIWFAFASILGFFLGLASFRMNPDFFRNTLQFLNDVQTSAAPTATTHKGVTPLDYARWLKDFEEILTRLKSSQLSHERRIEDVVQNSEKISTQVQSLYSDARIKNEANLEFRMAALVREVQQQASQGHKLQTGERVQISLMMEHCLRLCDAVEANAVHVRPARPTPARPEPRPVRHVG